MEHRAVEFSNAFGTGGQVSGDMGFARGQYEELVGAAWYLASDVSLYTTGTSL